MSRRQVCSALIGLGLIVGAALCLWPTRSVNAADATPKGITIEAELAAAGAPVYRDDRASGKRCVVMPISRGGDMLRSKQTLPPGEYTLTAYLEAFPVSLMHTLAVNITAGGTTRTLGAIQFDPTPGYHPYSMRFNHPGGPITISLSASGKVGFDGMRKDNTADEQDEKKKGVNIDDSHLLEKKKEKSADDDMDLEENPSITKLTHLDYRVVCDRAVITPVRQSPVVIERVDVDKVHYAPGETVKATVAVRGDGVAKLSVDLITEINTTRNIVKQDVTLATGMPTTVPVEFKLDDKTEFGHELRATVLQGDTVAHGASEYFGVSKNVYRVGITGYAGPQNTQSPTVEQYAAMMEHNKKQYANYFERFAWAPCDYSVLVPKTELFWSGQTQYPGSITGMKNLIAEGHKRGIKAITYGKASAAGIDGFQTFQRHPELFSRAAYNGTMSESLNTFFLERELHQEHFFPDVQGFRGWQHWASLWTVGSDAVVDYGCDALSDSAKVFGWDGVRWDGHFENGMARFKKRMNAQLPNYVHGYNIAFANPGSALFLPPAHAVEDFHECAKGHGLMMDESVRDWSNTNFSPGTMRPFYDAICREADYIKRIEGLPLFINFDMGSEQDRAFNILCGLAAGQRYTYVTTPGVWAFGDMTKFLTRYSAFVWDDTAGVADAANVVNVKVGAGPKDVAPWFDHSTWLRKLPDGKQQLLVHMLNPPGYGAFCNRVQTPPTTMRDVSVGVKTPSGAKLARVIHVSPDLLEGHAVLTAKDEGGTATVTLPELRTWSIVVYEYAPADGATLAYPAFKLTTPIEDARQYLEKSNAAKIAKAQQEKREAAQIAGKKEEPAAPYFADFTKSYNADEPWSKKLKRPADMNIRRDGVLDIHHVRGVFSWLNPIEAATGLAGGGNYMPSWVDYVGFRLNEERGCMDGFPDTFDQLLKYDVLVLDGVHARYLGHTRRAMIADYVNNGGGLLIFGGSYNLSMGADRNTALDALIPVEIKKYDALATDNKGMPLKQAKDGFWPAKMDWAGNPMAFSVDTSPLKPGVEVLAKVGDRPAIVSQQVGKGRVITVLMNVEGDYPANVTPYWLWKDWPRALSTCIAWLGQDASKTYTPAPEKKTLDPNAVDPAALLIEASTIEGAEFTKRLRSATKNMIDASTARCALEAALDNAERVDDVELIPQVAELASQYIDASFAPLAKKLVTSQHAFFRRAGYRVLGLAKDKDFRTHIERGLEEEDVLNQREALVALANLAVPESVPAIKRYLNKGSEKLLAYSALKRLGDPDAVKTALPLYSYGLRKWVALKCTRISAFEDLYGGVSFKLTPAARKAAGLVLDRAIERERAADFDVRFFTGSLGTLSDDELKSISSFLSETDSYATAPLAYAIAGRLPAARAAGFRSSLASAKLPQVRALAEVKE